MLLAPHVPRQLDDVLEERPDDLALHRLAADPRQPVELAVDFLARLGREIERLELLAKLLQVVPLVALAQLALDRLELLAQEHLALALAQLLLDLGLDVFLRVQHADLALHVHQDAAEPLLDAERLEQHLALGRRDVDVPGDQIREPARLVHAGEHLLDDLVRQPGLLAQLGRPRPGLPVQRDEGGILRVDRQHLLGLANHGLEVAFPLGIVNGDAPLLAVEQQLHARKPSLKLTDLGDGADRVQHVGIHALDVLSLGHGEHQALRGRECRLDGPKRRRASGADGGRDPGKQYHLTQRQHRQSQSFGHLGTTPSKARSVAGKRRYTARPGARVH